MQAALKFSVFASFCFEFKLPAATAVMVPLYLHDFQDRKMYNQLAIV